MAFAALFAAVSCTKEETTNDNTPVKINITVADLSPATRAIKSGWKSGDKINIWFDGVSKETPHLIITYNGTKWTAGTIDATAEAALKTNGTGTFKYLYEAGNKISAYEVSFDYMYEFISGTIGTHNYFAPVLTVCSPDTDPNYAFDGSVLTLNLNEWIYLTNTQVVITGLSGNPEDWCLTVQTSNSVDWYSVQDFRNFTNEAGFSFGYASGRASRGTNNGDGVAFYFRIRDSKIYNVNTNSNYADHTFTLYDSSKSYTFKKGYTPLYSAYATANPSATGVEKTEHTFTSVKVPFSNFTEVTP